MALTVGAAEVSAEAAIDIAKANISNNTETTVQVSWSGGGFIKPSKFMKLADAGAQYK